MTLCMYWFELQNQWLWNVWTDAKVYGHSRCRSESTFSTSRHHTFLHDWNLQFLIQKLVTLPCTHYSWHAISEVYTIWACLGNLSKAFYMYMLWKLAWWLRDLSCTQNIGDLYLKGVQCTSSLFYCRFMLSKYNMLKKMTIMTEIKKLFTKLHTLMKP